MATISSFTNHAKRVPAPELPLIGYREAARFLGMKIGTLYTFVHQKRIPHVRLGPRTVRFQRSALELWIVECAVDAAMD